MSIYHDLLGKIFLFNSGVVPMTVDPQLLGKKFPSNTGLVPMTAGHLPV